MAFKMKYNDCVSEMQDDFVDFVKKKSSKSKKAIDGILSKENPEIAQITISSTVKNSKGQVLTEEGKAKWINLRKIYSLIK